MSNRKAAIKAWSSQYRKTSKKEKVPILDELVALTWFNRWYVVGLLRWDGKVIRAGRRVRLVGDLCKKAKRTRLRLYGEAELGSLKQIWAIMDYLCGKRLAAILPEVIPILEKHREIVLDTATRKKPLQISASSIDRLLAAERRKWVPRGRSGTKPGTLLKHQIPIRTFADWNEKQAGFVEIDLVGHDGGDASGAYCQTLDVTDVASTWTETEAVINKAQIWVFDALKSIRAHLPFLLLGIDSDNGSEFINNHLLRYCLQEKITFTRGRAGKKNDGCFVEQKNYSVVRRAVGYARYDSPAQLRLLNELYGHLRLYTNYFQPVVKLKAKERNGAKVRKKYDEPKTPYQGLMEMPDINPKIKQRLKSEYATLNPAQPKREITRPRMSIFCN
ncbi:MAG: transposase family protein [Gallionella sp.]